MVATSPLHTSVSLDGRIRLEVNITRLEYPGQSVLVSWSGVQEPAYGDWLGLWVPAGADFQMTAPAKYQVAAMAPTHISNGQGELSFRLISYRQDMVFAFVREGFLRPVIAAVSAPISVANPNAPLQGHLAFTGRPGEMQMQWVTHNSAQAEVRWGDAPGQLPHSSQASSFSYSRAEMCGPPANTTGWADPGTQHVAVMTGLKPGQRYYYIYGEEGDGGWSEEASFLAAPPEGPEGEVHLLAVADLGQSEDDGSLEYSEMPPSLNTTRLMAADVATGRYGLLVHNGDISYARGYVTQWDNYFHQLQPVVSHVAYMVAPGNHERDWPKSGDRFNLVYDSGGECGVPYERRMKMPIAGADAQWYSFNYGPIHFLQYSTEHPFAPGTPQHAFIAADLAAVDRSKTPWVVVGGHRPMYISSSNDFPVEGDQVVAAELRAALEGLFLEHKVDMTWHGHHHSYQRSCPVAHGACKGYAADGSANAPVHLVIGHAGATLCLNVDLFPSPLWEKISLWWGYMRVHASATQLKCELVSDYDGKPIDEIVLSKPAGWGTKYMAGRRLHTSAT